MPKGGVGQTGDGYVVEDNFGLGYMNYHEYNGRDFYGDEAAEAWLQHSDGSSPAAHHAEQRLQKAHGKAAYA
jgi:hypothetical protein